MFNCLVSVGFSFWFFYLPFPRKGRRRTLRRRRPCCLPFSHGRCGLSTQCCCFSPVCPPDPTAVRARCSSAPHVGEHPRTLSILMHVSVCESEGGDVCGCAADVTSKLGVLRGHSGADDDLPWTALGCLPLLSPAPVSASSPTFLPVFAVACSSLPLPRWTAIPLRHADVQQRFTVGRRL